MANGEGATALGGPRSIVIYSDGTGQRGGLYFDEDRTNVYKLYRATRISPDSNIDPNQQVAFYDAGLGTVPAGGGTVGRISRKFYNFVSQATGLGITQNIIDCYAAIIRHWRPGDRIFLFGFSRGAYTVRCLSSVICMCGVPTTDKGGKPLHRDIGSSQTIAKRAVKSVYQHVSSPRDEKYTGQRRALAAAFRESYGCTDANDTEQPNAHPHFVGVFDTVASLSNTGSLVILCLVYLALHIALAVALATAFEPHHFGYWFGWIVVWTACTVAAAYVYTHLKFAWRLPGYYFWDIIHLTTFRQKFYDQSLSSLVKYARHALAIDECRNDFKRVPWGSHDAKYAPGAYKIDPFQQLWFAGNHADVGGGYPENQCRLSDIALQWMVDAATNPKLGDERLVVDSSVLRVHGRIDGIQHDETRSLVFRWAKKTLRDPVRDATLHPSVIQRFELDEVQQYDISAKYRPEALRDHERTFQHYANIPPPRMTCWQRIRFWRSDVAKCIYELLDRWFCRAASSIYPTNWKAKKAMNPSLKQFTPDSLVSCVGLIGLVSFVGTAAWIFLLWQIIPWLRESEWYSYAIARYDGPVTGWIGLDMILNWIFALPLTLLLVALGFLWFWLLGLFSTKLYQSASRAAGKVVTPAQTRA